MPALPPLHELHFAEIPQASQPHYTGDRFSYMEAGWPDRRGAVAARHWRQFAALAPSIRSPRRPLQVDRVERGRLHTERESAGGDATGQDHETPLPIFYGRSASKMRRFQTLPPSPWNGKDRPFADICT
jgi:hypothetical protein